MKVHNNRVFLYIVLIVWSGFIILNLATPQKVFSENENRYLAEMPEFSIDTLMNGEYMNGIEEYINDQFILRDQWIYIKTMMERGILKQDINSVYIAKDGYLIERYNYNSVSVDQAEKNRKYLAGFIEKYNQKLGSDRVKVMMVPTASEILTDKLPPFATGYNQNGYIDQLATSLPEDTFLDVRDTLLKHNEEYIYYKTDHHWTSLGAYYAYVKWATEVGFQPLSADKFNIEKASDQFYGTIFSKVNLKVQPDDIYLYQVKEDMDYQLQYDLAHRTDSLYDFSKLEEKDKYSVFMGGNHALVEVQTNQNNGRRLLVIKDSFAHSLVPFAVNHFEKTFMIDLRYYNGGIDRFVEENGITDMLVLYNTIGFANDANIGKVVY